MPPLLRVQQRQSWWTLRLRIVILFFLSENFEQHGGRRADEQQQASPERDREQTRFIQPALPLDECLKRDADWFRWNIRTQMYVSLQAGSSA